MCGSYWSPPGDNRGGLRRLINNFSYKVAKSTFFFLLILLQIKPSCISVLNSKYTVFTPLFISLLSLFIIPFHFICEAKATVHSLTSFFTLSLSFCLSSSPFKSKKDYCTREEKQSKGRNKL